MTGHKLPERDGLPEELAELDHLLREIRFQPRASLGPEIAGRGRRLLRGGCAFLRAGSEERQQKDRAEALVHEARTIHRCRAPEARNRRSRARRTAELPNEGRLEDGATIAPGLMTTVTLQLPDDVFSALRRSPEEFARELRLAAAIYWYEKGEISQEKAAAVAGLDRAAFLLALARERADAFVVDFDDLRRELGLA